MSELLQLATDAELNHWPLHLGVTTDAEKIAYLAQQLREAADAETRADELADELATSQEEAGMLETQVDEQKREIDGLKNKLAQIRELTL